jgi:hypothetical protein
MLYSGMHSGRKSMTESELTGAALGSELELHFHSEMSWEPSLGAISPSEVGDELRIELGELLGEALGTASQTRLSLGPALGSW